MTCRWPLLQSLFQCCSLDTHAQTHEIILSEAAVVSPRSKGLKACPHIQSTELTSQITNTEFDIEFPTEQDRASLHEIVMHMCSDTSSSFGESLLSFKKGLRKYRFYEV